MRRIHSKRGHPKVKSKPVKYRKHPTRDNCVVEVGKPKHVIPFASRFYRDRWLHAQHPRTYPKAI